MGNDAPLTDSALADDPPPGDLYPGAYDSSGNPYDGASGCTVDGQPMDCSFAARLVSTGAAGICPDNRCRPGMRLTHEGWNYGETGVGGGGIAYGVVDARTGAGWQKRSTPRQRRSDQRPQRRRQPQNPFPTYKEADEKNIPKEAPDPECDRKLAVIFGGKGAKASGSGYHPDGMMIGPSPAHGWNPHLFRTMHLFGNNTGTAAGEVYAPAGGGTPFSREKVAPDDGSWGIHYAKLGAVTNVTLVISHVKNYTHPGAINSRTLIGNIGGPGGDSGERNPLQPYIHSHLAILDSSGRNISFKDAFCR